MSILGVVKLHDTHDTFRFGVLFLTLKCISQVDHASKIVHNYANKYLQRLLPIKDIYKKTSYKIPSFDLSLITFSNS